MKNPLAAGFSEACRQQWCRTGDDSPQALWAYNSKEFYQKSSKIDSPPTGHNVGHLRYATAFPRNKNRFRGNSGRFLCWGREVARWNLAVQGRCAGGNLLLFTVSTHKYRYVVVICF